MQHVRAEDADAARENEPSTAGLGSARTLVSQNGRFGVLRSAFCVSKRYKKDQQKKHKKEEIEREREREREQTNKKQKQTNK